MILHFLTNHKFSDYPIRQFSTPEMQSEFVLIPNNSCDEECVVSQIDCCKVVYYNSSEYRKLLKTIGEYQAIFLHGLFCPWTEDVLRAVPDNVKVVWYFWGGEIYSRIDLNQSFLAPISKLAIQCHDFKNRISNNKSPDWELPISLFQKIDYCLTSIYEEFIFAKEYVNNAKIEHIWYTYYSMEDTFGSLISAYSQGNDVLFCNSAAIKNNMFDAVLYLAKRKNRKYLKGRRVIMPMGYGEPWVKRAMLKLGVILLGDKFCPIMDLLPIEKYNRMMTQCSTLILPYWQPAGQGNILTALWLGMRVYLSEKNIAFAFFNRIGAKVFSLENDFSTYHYSKLSDTEIETNRFVIRKWYSKEHVQQSVRDVVNTITTSKK